MVSYKTIKSLFLVVICLLAVCHISQCMCLFQGMQHDVLNGAQPYGLPLDQRLLSQELKDLDYSTHIVGKVNTVYHVDIAAV